MVTSLAGMVYIKQCRGFAGICAAADRTDVSQGRQRDLMKLIVQRMTIDGAGVVAMTLRPNYQLVLGHNTNGPTEFSVDPFVYRSGSDGDRSATAIPDIRPNTKITIRSTRRCRCRPARRKDPPGTQGTSPVGIL